MNELFRSLGHRPYAEIICDGDWNLYKHIDAKEPFFSLFLEGNGLQSYDSVYNVGLNSEMVEGIMRDTNIPPYAKRLYLEKYLHLLVKAVELADEGQSVSNRIEITERLLEHDQISEIWDDIQKLLTAFSSKTGDAFPQCAIDQLKLFVRGFSREWTNFKEVDFPQTENRGEDTFFFLLCTHDTLALEDDIKTAYSRAIPGYLESNNCDDLEESLLKILRTEEKRRRGIVAAKYLLIEEQVVIFDIKKLLGEDPFFVEGLLALYQENILSKKELIGAIPFRALDRAQNLKFSRDAKRQAEREGRLIGRGIGASPYSASGQVLMSWDSVDEVRDCIVIKERILPDDVIWIQNVEGVITKTGSFTSHPSVIMRQLGKALICGCEDLVFEENGFILSGNKYHEGDILSIDGESGDIYTGQIESAGEEQWGELLKEISEICSSICGVSVYVNSENPEQVLKSLAYGSSGIGLYRTEYMQAQKEIKHSILQYLITQDLHQRSEMLRQILSAMEAELITCLEAVGAHTATIRTLDFPMHELLSCEEEEQTLNSLREYNPMLGNRGSRLSILYPQLFQVQIDAVCRAYRKTGRRARVKILLPVIADVREITVLREYVKEVFGRNEIANADIQLGCMIETPRALFRIEQIATEVDFLSYGTNDLTQLVWGMSRDDSHKYLPEYIRRNIVNENPFVAFDVEGLFEPMKTSIGKARQVNPKIEIGVCGEQISDKGSLKKILELDIDYISVNAPKMLENLVFASLHHNYLQ